MVSPRKHTSLVYAAVGLVIVMCVVLLLMKVLGTPADTVVAERLEDTYEHTSSSGSSGGDIRGTLSVSTSPHPEPPLQLPFEWSQENESSREGDLSPLPEQALRIEGSGYEYQRFETLESWRLTSAQSCEEVARIVLKCAQAQGHELIEAGYMDLSGECWGCVLSADDGASLLVTLIPENPFGERSSANPLVVSLVQYLEPEALS